MKAIFSIFISLCIGSLSAAPCQVEQTPNQTPFKNRVRVEALNNLDQLLNKALQETKRTYALGDPLVTNIFYDASPSMAHFIQMHGYFSLYHPLVSKVTSDPKDIETVRCLLRAVNREIKEMALKKLITDEVLAKVLAYRDMQVGENLGFATLNAQGNMIFAEYTIDRVFNLWKGMPAFGLVSSTGCAPILLFRGTDFSLDSQRGWASLMSDIDLSGPGLHAFQRAQPQIHQWLEAVAQKYSKARLIGYSLGGALAAYTFIFENSLVSDEESFAFNPPGVAPAVIKKWDELAPAQRTHFVSFVNRGDPISKVGQLFGRVYELSLDAPMRPLTAHTVLISSHKQFYKSNVDVAAENASREKKQEGNKEGEKKE